MFKFEIESFQYIVSSYKEMLAKSQYKDVESFAKVGLKVAKFQLFWLKIGDKLAIFYLKMLKIWA